MKSSDVDFPGASKAPEVNENQDVRKVLLRLLHHPSSLKASQQSAKMKAQFNKPPLTSTRRRAASSFQPGLIGTEGVTLVSLNSSVQVRDGPAGASRGRCVADSSERKPGRLEPRTSPRGR